MSWSCDRDPPLTKNKADLDYHAEVEHHFYSAPHAPVHEEVEARLTAITVELLHKGLTASC